MRDLFGDLARDQQVEVAQPQREGGPGEDRRQLDPAGALVVALDVRAVLLVVDLGLLGVRHHVAGLVRAEVDVGLGDGGHARSRTAAAPAGRRRRGSSELVWLASATAAPLPWVYCRWVLTHDEDGRFAAEMSRTPMSTGRALPVERVAVDAERREQVVGPDALQALERLQRDGRVGVPLPDVVDGGRRRAPSGWR